MVYQPQVRYLDAVIARRPQIVLVDELAHTNAEGSRHPKRYTPSSGGTLPTGGALYVGFLLGVIVIVGCLTYLPALALGPLIEHLQIFGGILY
jgi:K+-transporting ATPase A subunit